MNSSNLALPPTPPTPGPSTNGLARGSATDQPDSQPPAAETTATPALPATPSKISATPASSHRILITWQNDSDSRNRVMIERACSPDGPFRQIGTGGPGVSSFDDDI